MTATTKPTHPRSWWFSGLLIVGIAGLGWLGFRPRNSGESQKAVLLEPNTGTSGESRLEIQTRTWSDGKMSGQTWLSTSTHRELNRADIEARADELYPTNRTANILWAMGFEQGQWSVSRRR